MFKILRDNEIRITRGDDAIFNCSIRGRELAEGDVLTMTVRKRAETAVEIELKSTDGRFELPSTATKSLPFGTYRYDIELLTYTGKRQTIIPYSKFIVEEEITE